MASGWKRTPEQNLKQSETRKRLIAEKKLSTLQNLGQYASRGAIPWNKGLKGTGTGEKNGMWKGDEAGYLALHTWIARQLGKPTTCEDCGVTGLTGQKIHWHNISGKYLRDIADWIRLCTICHKKHEAIRFNVI